jgi:hypothetical protein
MPPCVVNNFGNAEISFVIISQLPCFVKKKLWFFSEIFGKDSDEVKNMKIWKQMILFYLGGCAYVVLELLWRGRSHGSMFVAGGTCFLLLGWLNDVRPRLPLLLRVPVGAMVITMVELGIGLAVNRDYGVWDYRGRPGNFLGQICPAFTLLWIPVSAAAMVLYRLLERRLTAAVSGRKS